MYCRRKAEDEEYEKKLEELRKRKQDEEEKLVKIQDLYFSISAIALYCINKV